MHSGPITPFIVQTEEGKISTRELFSPPAELTFIDDTHEYYVNGQRLPSVSEILALDMESESYDGVPDHVLQKAADRGTKVHDAIQHYIQSGGCQDPWHPDPSTHAYLMLFNSFVKLGVMNPVLSEVRLYHPELRYAGTVDILALINGRPAIVDIKTTARYMERKCQLQLAGYGNLIGFWHEEFDRIFDRVFSDRNFHRIFADADRFILHLDRSKGRPQLHRMRDTESHDRDFRALVERWHATT